MPRASVRFILSCPLFVCMPLMASGADAPSQAPAYPLYAIASGNVNPTPEDIEILARSFTLVQANFTSPVVQALHRVNPDFKVVKYANSTYTQTPEDAVRAEREYRKSLSMFRAALLSDPMTGESQEFGLRPVEQGNPIPLKASTIGGAVSSDGKEQPSTRRYVTWIRIGDELMRIEAFDAATGRIRVTRGFDGSSAAAHAANDPVFSPIYLGSVNDTGAYPGGPGRSLRYSFDPANPAGAQWCVERAVDFMTNGFDGVWLDICSASPFNMAGADGKRAVPWDFRTGKPYDRDAFREGQEIKIDAIQKAVHEKFGRWPILIANNMKARTFEPGDGGEKLLLAPTKIKPRPLEGYCIEDFVGGFAPRAANRRKDKGPAYHPVDKWRENVIMLMKCAQGKLAAYPMIANAGIKSLMLEDLGVIRDQFEMFAYASYLIGIEKDSPTRLGLPAFYREGERRFARLHPRYTWPIGAPAQTVAPDQIDRYRPEGHVSYVRRFENGVALVNPDDKDDAELRLDAPYKDPETGEEIAAVQIKAHTGRILLRSQTNAGAALR